MARCQLSAQQPGLLSSPLSEGIRSRGGGILCVAHRGPGAEAPRQVQGCALRAPAPCAFLKWRGRHLGAGRFQGNRSKKDVISFTFLDLEAASQETKGSVEVGEAAVLPKWILSTFSGTSVCVGFVFCFPFLSSSPRFGTNKIAAKFECLCLLNGRISELLFHHVTCRSGKAEVHAAL